jgi:hypothetical protein
MAKTAFNGARKLSATFTNGVPLSVSIGRRDRPNHKEWVGALHAFGASIIASAALHLLARLIVSTVED